MESSFVFFDENASLNFYGPSTFFRFVIKAFFFKNFKFFKANKLYIFFVIKWQVIYH
jgi:hypothetical protein